MELRDWQHKALERFEANTDDFLAVATPGAGKTTFALTAASSLLARGEVTQIITVVPTAHLRRQWANSAAGMGLHLDWAFENGAGAYASDFHGIVVTYQAVAASPLLFHRMTATRPTLVILDEVHHTGEPRDWGRAVRNAFQGATRRLLLSGTPFRSDNSPIPFVTYDAEGRCVPGFNYDYGQALRDRDVVRPIEFRALDGDVRWRAAGTVAVVTETTLKDADEATLANALKSALKPDGDWISSVLRTADAELTRQRIDVPDAGGLVVAADQAKAYAYADLLGQISGEPATVAVSDEPAASKRITDFAKGSSRWIVAVQMVSEGVDIPRLAVGVYASRTRTEMFFRQVVGRFVRMRGSEDATYATLFIPSIQPLLRYASEIEATVDRTLAEEEEQVFGDRERGEGMSNDSQVTPLNPSEALFHSLIYSGESFTDAELRQAEALAAQVGLSSAQPAQVAMLLRAAAVTAPVPVPAPARPVESRTDQKNRLRKLIQTKVGRFAAIRGVPHSYVNNDLNRMMGEPNVNAATMHTLERRLELLEKWIRDAS